MRTKLVVQSLEHVRDRSVTARFIRNRVAQIGTGNAQKLRVRSRKVVLRSSSKDEDAADGRGGVVDRSDHLRGSQALLDAPIIRREGCRVDGQRKVLLFEAPQVQISNRSGRNRQRIEEAITEAPLLIKDPFVLNAGDGSAWTDPNPGPSPEPHRRCVRWLDGYDRDVPSEQHVRGDGQGGRRDDVPIGLDVRKRPQQFVGDRDARRPAVIMRSYEDDAPAPAIRQIVREGAHGFSDARGGVAFERLLAFDEVGLPVGHERLELSIGVGGCHSSEERVAIRSWTRSMNSCRDRVSREPARVRSATVPSATSRSPSTAM